MKTLKESYKKVVEVFSKNEAPRIQRVEDVAENIQPQLPTLILSGTSTIMIGKQREDVFSRDIIIEKNGFRTQTQQKYFQDIHHHYYSKPVNPGFYRKMSFTGTTQLIT